MDLEQNAGPIIMKHFVTYMCIVLWNLLCSHVHLSTVDIRTSGLLICFQCLSLLGLFLTVYRKWSAMAFIFSNKISYISVLCEHLLWYATASAPCRKQHLPDCHGLRLKGKRNSFTHTHSAFVTYYCSKSHFHTSKFSVRPNTVLESKFCNSFNQNKDLHNWQHFV